MKQHINNRYDVFWALCRILTSPTSLMLSRWYRWCSVQIINIQFVMFPVRMLSEQELSSCIESYFTSLHSRACCVLLNMCGDVNSPWNVLWCWFSGSWNCSPAPLILMQVSLWDQQCHLVLRSGGGRRAQMKKRTILNIFSIRDEQLIWRQYNSNALHQLLRLISVSHLYNLSPN